MVETTVKFVLEKITTAAVKEVLHLWGVEKQVEKVKSELDWIQAFLKDADRKQIQDERQKKWVKEVREVAYWIEDVIDTFLCEVPQKKSGKWESMKMICTKTKKISVIRKLESEIEKILEKIREINRMRDAYGINNLGEGVGQVKKLPVRPPVLPDIDDRDVVGLDLDRDNILEQLLDKNTPRRCVVSIVGQGGLGKTTLAKKVYNSYEVQREFDIRIWVAISQEYELLNVLRKIRGELQSINESEQGKDEEYFLTDLHRSLGEKKYLIIIDDVWKTHLWMNIEKALPNTNNGSRILMTTRYFDVAKGADPTREPYKLRFLTEEPSLELFLKKAIPSRQIQNECPDNIFNLAKLFVNECGGLPLAIIVLGSLLAKKQFTFVAWSRVMETINWHVGEQKMCMEIITTSYDDLPLVLKSCFMYFAAFPKDYNIYAPSLIQMWIAEGFIPDEENRTLEHTAESFLEDLVQRSMIQVSKRSLLDNSIVSCRIHDLLRDVAIQRAREDNFLTVYSNQDGAKDCGQARRLAVHNLNSNELLQYANPNLRTLLCFNSQFPDCSRHKLLKVLNGMGRSSLGRSDRANMKWFEELYQLRYLQLNVDTVVWEQSCFEKLIGGMKFLQTLDLAHMYKNFDLPDSIWHIKTIRHVMLPYGKYILTPPPYNQTDLQTLYGVKSCESWENTNLPNLCALRIEINERLAWNLVAIFLGTLKRLVKLTIKGRDIPTEVVNMRAFPFYQSLTLLRYFGRLSCHRFDVAMFPAHLTQLAFYGSELRKDHLSVLEKLQELKRLALDNAYLDQEIKCSAGGFPCLQMFSLTKLGNLKTWEIEEGAMPMLNSLSIGYCQMLQVPHEMQHLSALTKLSWWFDQSDEFGSSKAKEVRNICKHVPFISLHY